MANSHIIAFYAYYFYVYGLLRLQLSREACRQALKREGAKIRASRKA
jgi:hypothetical protein